MSRGPDEASSPRTCLPSCGSACTYPVRTSEAVHASTAIRVMRRPSSADSRERCSPRTHSVTSTRRLEYSGSTTGVPTKPRKSSDASNRSPFRASFA